jgi:hypothetical protein
MPEVEEEPKVMGIKKKQSKVRLSEMEQDFIDSQDTGKCSV